MSLGHQPWTCAEQRGILLKESRLAELPFLRYPRAIAVKILVFHLADNRAAWYLEREILWCFFKRSSYAACRADKENRRIGSQQLIVDISIKRVNNNGSRGDYSFFCFHIINGCNLSESSTVLDEFIFFNIH